MYYALTPDFRTLFVPQVTESVKRSERDGKKLTRIDYTGVIRAWDLQIGQEKESLTPPEGMAPAGLIVSPGGRYLICVERSSYFTSDIWPTYTTVAWDLAAGKKIKLGDKSLNMSFTRDGKVAVARYIDHPTNSSALILIDLATGKELAKVDSPGKGWFFSLPRVSSDGTIIAIEVGGKRGAPIEVWFFDARTLEKRGRLTGKCHPDSNGWGVGKFTPDSKHYIELDGVGNALVWNFAERKLEQTLPLGSGVAALQMAISPDSKTLAVGWSPPADPEVADQTEPEPRDLPQPRVSLIDLTGKAPPRMLIAPNGRVGNLVFSPDGKTLAFGSSGAVRLFDLTK